MTGRPAPGLPRTAAGRRPYGDGRTHHAQAARDHVPEPRRRPAGAGRPRGGPQRRLPVRGLVRAALGRRGRRGDGARHGTPLRPAAGRRTYDIFAAFWPQASEEQGAGPLNRATKHVASRGRPELTWDRSVLLEGDVPAAVRRLKEGDGPELQVHGSGELLQTLLQHRLVDVLHLVTYPVVLGTGKRLFGPGTAQVLRVVESRTTAGGVHLATYEPAGEVTTGSFG
nr:dihydrofolate reductase family protein [Vallicoccus soli]